MTTIWSENAHRFATRDRTGTAEQLLDVACREVVAAYRVSHRLGLDSTGLVEAATSTLNTAADKAERLIGARP